MGCALIKRTFHGIARYSFMHGISAFTDFSGLPVARACIMATFQEYSKVLSPEFHFHGEFSSLQAGLTCMKHTFQDIARIIFYGISVSWRILCSTSVTPLYQTCFSRYIKTFTQGISEMANSLGLKRDAFDSIVLFKIEQGAQHGYSVFWWMLCNPSVTGLYGDYFSKYITVLTPRISESWRILSIQLGRACRKCTFQDIATNSSMQSLNIGTFSSLQAWLAFLNPSFQEIAGFFCMDSYFLGEFSLFQGVCMWMKWMINIEQDFHTWDLIFLANSLQFNGDALLSNVLFKI